MSTPQRIHIVGTAGSGKTSLGREIAARLGITHVELDALHWEPGWTKPTIEEFRNKVRQALSGPAWVAEGNYSEVRPVVWERVELVVWLDYSLGVCIWRVLVRTLRRIFSQTELWHGNRETIAQAFFSPNSLFLYVLTTHRRRRQRYADLFAQPENGHFRVVRLKKTGELEGFIDSLIS